MTPAKAREIEDGAWLSIGALSRATGIAIETLRTWESRYGFPVPERKASGHRVYPVAAVARLRRIAQALSLGHRAGQVVGASEESVARLLESSASAAEPSLPSSMPRPTEDVPGLLRHVKAFDGERLTRQFQSDWARMGPVEFLEARIGPLIRAVGEGWEQHELEIRHEHFLSERVGDLLRSLRMPLEERATGVLVVFATLPGEVHGLGLQMSALILAAAGAGSSTRDGGAGRAGGFAGPRPRRARGGGQHLVRHEGRRLGGRAAQAAGGAPSPRRPGRGGRRRPRRAPGH